MKKLSKLLFLCSMLNLKLLVSAVVQIDLANGLLGYFRSTGPATYSITIPRADWNEDLIIQLIDSNRDTQEEVYQTKVVQYTLPSGKGPYPTNGSGVDWEYISRKYNKIYLQSGKGFKEFDGKEEKFPLYPFFNETKFFGPQTINSIKTTSSSDAQTTFTIPYWMQSNLTANVSSESELDSSTGTDITLTIEFKQWPDSTTKNDPYYWRAYELYIYGQN